MKKAIRSEELTDKLTLSECEDGFWLYDYDRGMNLSMRAKTEKDAFIDVIKYYQKRLSKVESEFKELENCVLKFISSLPADMLPDVEND